MGERDFSASLLTSSLQRDTKRLQEINFNKLTKNKPNFYQFFNVFRRTKDSMISLIQGVYKSFTTQENLSPKTLNPKVNPVDSICFPLLKPYPKREE
jgi:hypothetical protein